MKYILVPHPFAKPNTPSAARVKLHQRPDGSLVSVREITDTATVYGATPLEAADLDALRTAESLTPLYDAPFNTLQSVVNEIVRRVQDEHDALARSWGYDSVISCATYATSTIPQFAAEATAIIAWRDARWTACYEALNTYSGGALPDIDTFVASLPDVPAKPEL